MLVFPSSLQLAIFHYWHTTWDKMTNCLVHCQADILLQSVEVAHRLGCLEDTFEKALIQHDLSSIPNSSASTFFWDCWWNFNSLDNQIQHHCATFKEPHRNTVAFRCYVDPGVERTHPIEPMKSLCALLWTLVFVPLLSVSVSESPSPLSLLWLGFQLWMLPLTTSVIPRQPTYPCLPPLMCDLMYCLTVFPPFKINCSFISPQDKKASREHNSLKVVWILFKQNN